MNFVIIGLGLFYGGIMVLTGGLMLTQKRLGRLNAILMLLGGIAISYAYFDKGLLFSKREIILIVGLLMVHISAIMNGYKLHGKPHVKHHLIRAVISLALVVGSVVVYK